MNVETLLADLQIHYRTADSHRNVRSGWVGVDCPWCGRGSGKYHLGICLATGQTSCWQCGGHSLASILVELTGRPFRDVLPRLQNVRLKRQEAREHSGRYRVPNGVGELRSVHKRYLMARKVDEATAALWGLQGLGLAGNLSWRIFMPIRLRGEPLSWTTRSLGSGMKYISARPEEETVPCKHLLYGEDLAGGSVVVVEGPFDAIRIGPGAVATLGVRTTSYQILRIARYADRSILFDNEPAAQRRAQQLADRLSIFPGRTRVVEIDAPADPPNSPG